MHSYKRTNFTVMNIFYMALPYDPTEHPDEEDCQGKDGEETNCVKDKSVCPQVGWHKNLSLCTLLCINFGAQMKNTSSTSQHSCLSSGSETLLSLILTD